jgi:hydrogenase maturation protease
MNMTTPSHLLIIGYGNTLRGDDGVGPRAAEAVGTLRLPRVRTLICQQLSPEHSAPVSQAHTVIFVDAAVGAAAGRVQWRELTPGRSSQLLAHAADPRTLLALARDVFGHAPAAWWLTIPAVNLDFGEELSPAAAAGLSDALHRIKAVAEQFCPADGKNCEAVANPR